MVVYPGNTQGRHPNERGPRGVYVVDVDEQGAASSAFVAVDTVRWEYLNIQIDGMHDDSALFSGLEDRVGELLTQSDGRHVVYRIRLQGRGAMHESLSRMGTIDELVTQLNATWASRDPFAFCGGVVDATRSEIDRAALLDGEGFIGDFLALTDEVARDEGLVADLRQELALLYKDERARRYLEVSLSREDDVPALVAVAEDVALGLLVDDDVPALVAVAEDVALGLLVDDDIGE